MSRTVLSLGACLMLAISTVNAGGIDFDEIFGGSNSSSSCAGTSISGYCCNGSVINPSGDFMNNGDTSLDGVICCVGDSNTGFNNGGPSSCTAGSAVPLTEAATASAPAGSASAAASTTAAMESSGMSMSMSSAAAQSSNAGSSQAIQSNGAETTAGGSQQSASAASGSAATQSSDGGAPQMMATFAPAVGGVMVGMFGLF